MQTDHRITLNPNQLKNLLGEVNTVLTIEQCSKPCPSCQVRIEKNGGCQHMTCRACSMHFCWVCGWFARSYGAHPCAVRPEEVQASLPPDLSEKVDQLLFDSHGTKIESTLTNRVQVCPREGCRKVNVKAGSSNMLACDKCSKTFCFLCGEAVYGKFHYAEYGCKMHTPVNF